MNEKLYTQDEVGEALRVVRDRTGISRRELAERLGCSASTVTRLETSETMATTEMFNRLQALTVLGQNYLGGAAAEAAAGAAGGVAGATAAVSAAGTVGGLSAAGMTSGLAALGLGSMATGIGVVAAIPIAAGLASYGVIKGLKSLIAANKLDCEAIDDVLEIRLKMIDSE